MDKPSFNELAAEGERLCQSGDYVNGIKCFESATNAYKSLRTTTGNDEDTKALQTLCVIYNQMGNAYFCLQNYTKALEYHKNDLKLSESVSFFLLFARAFQRVFMDFSRSGRHFADESGMSKACGNIGNTLQLLGQYDEAIKYTLQNLQISKKLRDMVRAPFDRSDPNRLLIRFD
jgi:tetratricopeptide (TPR) repeat protein